MRPAFVTQMKLPLRRTLVPPRRCGAWRSAYLVCFVLYSEVRLWLKPIRAFLLTQGLSPGLIKQDKMALAKAIL